MSSILHIKTKLGADGTKVRAYLYGLTESKIGDVVVVHFNGHAFKFGEMYVVTKEVKELRYITEEDLSMLKGPFKVLSYFWKKLEAAYATGIPGDAKISILTLDLLSNKPTDNEPEMVVDVADLAPNIPKPIKPKLKNGRRKRRK